MRLTDYVRASESLKKKYFDSLSMQVGLRYFGGKAIIGKYLINRIMEMQAFRYVKNGYKPAKRLVDCFTGGGKIALTIPSGWFDEIVMNDLNYGVYSFYMCCKHAPLALIGLINDLGKIMCYDIFMMCAQNRSAKGKNLEEWKQLSGYSDDEIINGDMLLSAAMTYWVTQGSWLGETDPEKVTYALNVGNKNENEEIRKVISRAPKRIKQINDKMLRNHIIVENMDYVELIEKYYGDGDETIFYLDPPYHAATLNKSNGNKGDEDEGDESKKEVRKMEERPAPYEDSFRYEQTNAMTYLLATMKWFIKSDYDPYYFFRDTYQNETELNKHREPADYYHDFDIIENLDEGFYREYLGSFHKGTSSGHDEGMEVIWTRYDGSVESLEWMQVSEEDRLFWVTKRTEREMWLNIKEEIYKAKCKARLIQVSDDARQKLLDENIKKIVNAHQIDYSIISV